MAKPEENKKEEGEKILVEKKFLMEITKAIESLKKEFNQFKQGIVEKGTSSAPNPSSLPDHIFQCVKIISLDKMPATPEEMAHYQRLDKEFEAELQPLMKKYKVIQLTAMFLKRL